MQITAKEFAEKHGIDVVAASSILSFFAAKGQVTHAGQRKSATGKGRSAKVYEVADTVTISL